MNIVKGIVTGLLAAIIAGAAPDLLAQMPGGGRMRGGDRGATGGSVKGPQQSSQENIAELVEYRLLTFEEDLKLSPAQQKTWDPYADKVRALVADITRERARAQAGTHMDAMQQMNHAVDVARNRLTALEDTAASAATLYQGLTPEQKLLADSRFATITPIIAGGGPSDAMGRGRPPQGGGSGPPRSD